MKSSEVVIGANYGDEGKGLITDFLSSNYGDDVTVIRFNSSAQAGHTVQTPERDKHIFHHVGSGSLTGARTHLSKYFVSHPMLITDEIEDLKKLNVNPRITADPRGLVIVPYDMLINQIVEDDRTEKHGSCGIGFNECIERSQDLMFQIRVADLNHKFSLRDRLEVIRDRWVPKRLKQLRLFECKDPRMKIFQDDMAIERWLWDVEQYLSVIQMGIAKGKNYIFEGAQGLALDQKAPGFPHLTRSNTGLKNVVNIAKELNIDELNVTYVSRCYLTRHGIGPLPNEVKKLEWAKVKDGTNTVNKYQGPLRFAPIDINEVNKRASEDLSGIKINKSLAITCLDQVESEIEYIENQAVHAASINEFMNSINVHMSLKYVSYGPTRDDIIQLVY